MSETLPEALYQYPASYSLRTQGVDLSEIAPSARSRSLEQLYEYTESTSVSTGVEDSFPEIAADYFCRMQTEDPDHFKLVERYESILAQRWPMAEPKLATVAIAVAAHEEVDSVIKTLDIYKKDTSVDNFEVLMFLNMPRFNAEGGLNSSDQLHISIRKFIEDNPTFPLRVFSHTYSQPQPIGSIKKLLQDVAALRSLRHGARDPILVLSDADLIDKQRGYMDVMTRPFVDQSVDTVVGDLDWDHEAFAHYPELLIATRFHQIIDEVCRNNSGFVATPGASTSVRLSSLLRLGGTRKV